VILGVICALVVGATIGGAVGGSMAASARKNHTTATDDHGVGITTQIFRIRIDFQ
jgi:hypothetical protein